MTTYLCTGDVFCSAHEPPDERADHPERPDRVRAIIARLEATGLPARCEFLPPRPAEGPELDRVHSRAYQNALAARSFGGIDEDTYVSPGSLRVALFAAGSATELALRVYESAAGNGFAVIRPPGHHASKDRAGGFCLFNNVAVAAATLSKVKGARVAIVDFDAHHGNGTQDIFYSDPSVLFVSLHQHPFWPFSGREQERGEGAGLGLTLNVPIPARTDSQGYLERWRSVVLPALHDYRPDVILVSAGFDAHRLDPEANLNLESADYGTLVRDLLRVQPRVAALLEGGYHREATAESAEHLLRALLDPNG